LNAHGRILPLQNKHPATRETAEELERVMRVFSRLTVDLSIQRSSGAEQAVSRASVE